MRTEDFITSSSKNPNLQLIDTTVINMTPQSKNIVLITLSYNNYKVIILETVKFGKRGQDKFNQQISIIFGQYYKFQWILLILCNFIGSLFFCFIDCEFSFDHQMGGIPFCKYGDEIHRKTHNLMYARNRRYKF